MEPTEQELLIEALNSALFWVSDYHRRRVRAAAAAYAKANPTRLRSSQPLRDLIEAMSQEPATAEVAPGDRFHD